MSSGGRSFVIITSNSNDRFSEDSDIEIIEHVSTFENTSVPSSTVELRGTLQVSIASTTSDSTLSAVDSSAEEQLSRDLNLEPENVSESDEDHNNTVNETILDVTNSANINHGISEDTYFVQPEPSRLQIIRPRQELESLPESDAPLADMQDAGAYEEDLGEAANVLNSHIPLSLTNNVSAEISETQIRFRPQRENDNLRLNGDFDIRREYAHYRHGHSHSIPTLFAKDEMLTKTALFAFIFAFALGLGHYLGSQSVTAKIENHSESLDNIRGELSRCRIRQDDLEAMLNDLKANMVPKRFVEKWENLYQEGEGERESLKVSMEFYKSRYDKGKEDLSTCQSKLIEMSQLQMPNIGEADPMKVNPSTLGKLKARIAALENQKRALEEELTELRKSAESSLRSNVTVNCDASVAAIKQMILEEMERHRFVVLHEVRDFLQNHQVSSSNPSKLYASEKDNFGQSPISSHSNSNKNKRQKMTKQKLPASYIDDDENGEEDSNDMNSAYNLEEMLENGRNSLSRMQRAMSDKAKKLANWVNNRMHKV